MFIKGWCERKELVYIDGEDEQHSDSSLLSFHRRLFPHCSRWELKQWGTNQLHSFQVLYSSFVCLRQGSLGSPALPGTSSIDQASPWTHKDLPACASGAMGLKLCMPTSRLGPCIQGLRNNIHGNQLDNSSMLDITKEINGVIRQSLHMGGNRQPLDRMMFNLHVFRKMRPP